MEIADDGIQYTQSLLLGLIVSFLLAKLFSILLFTSGDDEPQNLSSPHTNPNNHQSDDGISSSEKDRRSEAEFSMKHITGEEEKELYLVDHREGTEALDDWEGVETTELDEAFCAATGFVAAVAADQSEKKVSKSLQLQLYGLYKIATQGACCAPQPSAFKITARAKWNAWHKLGAMSPEEAMHKYLEIITELFPNWADGSTSKIRGGDNNVTSSEDSRPMGPGFSSFMHDEQPGNEFKSDAIHDFARESDADKLLKCIDDCEGQTPSHWAVDLVHIGVSEMPSSRNADIKLKDNEGRTPSHYAAVCERNETGELLVKKNPATGRQDDGEVETDIQSKPH